MGSAITHRLFGIGVERCFPGKAFLHLCTRLHNSMSSSQCSWMSLHSPPERTTADRTWRATLGATSGRLLNGDMANVQIACKATDIKAKFFHSKWLARVARHWSDR
jgi:hypothetical protein